MSIRAISVGGWWFWRGRKGLVDCDLLLRQNYVFPFLPGMCHWCNKPGPPAELRLEMPLSMVCALHFPLPKQDTVRNRVQMCHQAHSSSVTLTSAAPRMSAWVKPALKRKTAPADQFIGFRDIYLPSSPHHLIGIWRLTYYWTLMAIT